MQPKLFLGIFAIILFAMLMYVLADELFEYMTDPQAQADIGREVGIVRASEKREAEGKTEGE